MKSMSREIRIACAAIAGILVLYFGMNFLKGKRVLSTDSTYYVKFSNISGLSASNPVFANGFQVGVVNSVIYDYHHNGDVVVQLSANPSLRIPRNSTAEIESDMMGNVKMNLVMNHSEQEFLQPGDTLTGSVNAGMMGKVAEMVPAIERVLPKLDSIMASLNALLADPAVAQTLHNARDVSEQLTTTTAQLNVLLGNVNHRLPGMMDKMDATLANAQQISGQLTGVDFTATFAKVDQTLDKVNHFTQQLSNPNGTLGLLLSDSSMYHNLNQTLLSTDSLLVNLRQHPKRYVHFSLFGRKDN